MGTLLHQTFLANVYTYFQDHQAHQQQNQNQLLNPVQYQHLTLVQMAVAVVTVNLVQVSTFLQVLKVAFISETFDNFDHLNHHWPKILANLNSFFRGQSFLRLKFKLAGILGHWLFKDRNCQRFLK